MLKRFVPDPRTLRGAQAVGAGIFALIVAYLARRAGIRLLSEAAVALVRGISQIIVVGLLLTLVLGSAQWLTAFVLLGMMLGGTLIAAQRTKNIPGVLQVTMRSILLGAGLVIGGMVGFGGIASAPAAFIPVGSIVFTHALNTTPR